MTVTKLMLAAVAVALLGVVAIETATAGTRCRTVCHEYGGYTSCRTSCY